jgi:hypothetical protein
MASDGFQSRDSLRLKSVSGRKAIIDVVCAPGFAQISQSKPENQAELHKHAGRYSAPERS